MADERRRRAWREAIAAVGVILSLLFVGYEIRQNTSAQRSATLEGIANQRTEFNLAIWTDDRMPGLLLKLRNGALAADFTEEETQRLRVLYVHYLRIFEGAYRQVGVGVIEPDDASFFSAAFLEEQWPTLRAGFEPAFAQFIQEEFLR